MAVLLEQIVEEAGCKLLLVTGNCPELFGCLLLVSFVSQFLVFLVDLSSICLTG